jgi:hypothetical protein
MGVTRPPSSPPRVASSQSRGMGSLLSGTSISGCMSKCLRAEGGLPSSLSQQPPPAQVTFDCEGEGDAVLRVGDTEMGLTLLHDA